MTRVLLGQLASNGDCLYATTIARQIKQDFPGCHLTWAIATLCRPVIENNPDVDHVWEIPVASWGDVDAAWYAFEAEAWRQVARGAFDHAFMTQICPNYFANYDGTIRPSLFRNYPRPITVPVETEIRLADQERERVTQWVEKKRVRSFDKTVIFECTSKSGQSFLTPTLAVEVARRVVAENPNIGFVLSTHESIEAESPQIIHGGELSIRETAELTHLCDLFVGCGSGLTVVATSAAAKPNLPNIQILERSKSVFASFKHDFEYFGKPNDHFLETTESDPEKISRTILAALTDGIEAAKSSHDETLQLDFTWYFELIDQMLLRKRRYIDAAQSLMTTAERYGCRHDLMRYARALVLPFVELDARAQFPGGKDTIARFSAMLADGSKTRWVGGTPI